MLAYISPATSNTSSPRHNSNVQLPTVAMAPSALSRTSAKATTASRSSAPASATTSPLFQPSHPATPPAFVLASPHPVRLNNIGKNLSLVGAVSSKASSAGTPCKGMDHLGVQDNFLLDDSSALESTSPEPTVRRCEDLERGLREFEDILLDEVESSESSSDASDVEELEMDDGGVRKARKSKKSIGWQKGVARDMARFQLIVDVPLWTPGCFQDLSSMQDVRDRTLSSLHSIVDNLRLRGGVRTTYRLLSTANGGSWGCIRVAPFMSSSTSHSHQSFINRNEQKPGPPAAFRRSTFAGPALSRRLFAGASIDSSAFLSGHADLPAGGTSEDEKQEVARVIQSALENHGDGSIPESSVFLLALHGQPALIIT